MASGDVRQDLQTVKNLIESCIQSDLSRADTVKKIFRDAEIQPGATELVWQLLEEQNREFFDAYYIRLALKQQIEHINKLWEKQSTLMKQIPSTACMPASNGCRMTQFQQNAGGYPLYQTGPSIRPQSLQPTMAVGLTFTNGASTFQTPRAFDLSSSTRRNDFLPNALHGQSSNSLRLMQGLNGETIETESGYPSASPITFDAGGNVVVTLAFLENASVAAFCPLESTSQPLNEMLPGLDSSLSGQLGQTPKNFSFPELSALSAMDSFENCDNCPIPAFATADADNFFDSKDRVKITENDKLETISETCTIEDFLGSAC